MIPSHAPFSPRPPWLGGTLQTLRALRWPFAARLTPGHRLWLPLADGDALAAMLHLPPLVLEPARPLAVLVHGLTGSEEDPYLRDAAAGLLRRGFPVLRLNLRGSGPSLPRSTSHYHLGRAGDLQEALAALPAMLTGQGVVLAGWSLGGALVLNLLGRDTAGLPPVLGAAAIGPPLQPELAFRTIDANPLFGRALLALYRREVLAVPAVDLPESLRQAARRASSLVEFEATVTAPRFGYPSYAVYCEVNRPAAALPQIRVPTLVVMAADDPLVPIESLAGIDWAACPAVAPLAVEGGGHCGFYDRRQDEPLSLRAMAAFFEGLRKG
ncbi:alpha/beta fold hydrolase [Paeniroseomonas aquatica]|uniref:Alpha/beta fold hydrolase n=1 Tax=Paeniroseomonas aquatica TaxID=373043 RepID=A0ABT8A0D4_9PROT|nr:alpha/beta fold hydrolase [Paeniroseomonas aquatica]MDN3563184.1 alpha/beta fold hydrolase [Paeniroseomonas aquatica]